jgi:hypothetical protein
MDFKNELEKARDLPEIFEVVKAVVAKLLGRSRGGLMLGLANLGNHPNAFLGGFFTVGSNVIVMNKIPLQKIKETRPDLYKPYAFSILLHEYLHSLGYLDEIQVRNMVCSLTKEALGEKHAASDMAGNAGRFMKYLVYQQLAWQPENSNLQLVENFDSSSVSYIA